MLQLQARTCKSLVEALKPVSDMYPPPPLALDPRQQHWFVVCFAISHFIRTLWDVDHAERDKVE